MGAGLAGGRARTDAGTRTSPPTPTPFAPFKAGDRAAPISVARCAPRGRRRRGPRPCRARGPDVPVLVLSGRADLRTPLEDARRTPAQYPHAHAVLSVPDVGHSVLTSDTQRLRGGGGRGVPGRRAPVKCCHGGGLHARARSRTCRPTDRATCAPSAPPGARAARSPRCAHDDGVALDAGSRLAFAAPAPHGAGPARRVHDDQPTRDRRCTASSGSAACASRARSSSRGRAARLGPVRARRTASVRVRTPRAARTLATSIRRATAEAGYPYQHALATCTLEDGDLVRDRSGGSTPVGGGSLGACPRPLPLPRTSIGTASTR